MIGTEEPTPEQYEDDKDGQVLTDYPEMVLTGRNHRSTMDPFIDGPEV
jgi:hypothetical protein